MTADRAEVARQPGDAVERVTRRRAPDHVPLPCRKAGPRPSRARPAMATTTW
ncbi:MAG: hypothetical protein MZW92_09605 [Comamonadaceae bacterium]|nr:hypothetical protein [Comamonadaceae bacterium]